MSAGSGGVLDASVVLAVVLDELAPADVGLWFDGACISAVNMAEVVSRLSDLEYSDVHIADGLERFKLDVRPFTIEQAYSAGVLRPLTRHAGLSLGDRACLALAQQLDRPAITADRAWASLDLDIPIKLIR